MELGVGNFINIVLRRIEQSGRPLRLVNFVRSENQIKNDKAKLSNHTFLMEGMASFWEFGGKVDWKTYHQEYGRKRISLPNYPFEKVPYNLKVDSFVSEKSNSDLERTQDLSKWFYVPSWKKSPLLLNCDELKGHKRNLMLLSF